jgi:hypothetical protein
MTRKRAKIDFHQAEYETALDVVLQTLAECELGVDITSLTNEAVEVLFPQRNFRKRAVKDYVQRIVFDLWEAGIVEPVPDSQPIMIRPLALGREAVLDATRRGHTAIVKRLLGGPIDSETKNTALISAVINNRVEIVRLFIQAGADVNTRETLFHRTPLMYVSDRTNKAITMLLKTAGAVE